MAGTVYAGVFLTRRVKLDEGEIVLRSANAFRYGRMGFFSAGILSMTAQRLIWTPIPYFWDIWPWIATRPDVLDVSLHRNTMIWLVWYPWQKWAVQIQARKSTYRFGFGADWPLRDQRTNVDHWLGTIREWMN